MVGFCQAFRACVRRLGIIYFCHADEKLASAEGRELVADFVQDISTDTGLAPQLNAHHPR